MDPITLAATLATIAQVLANVVADGRSKTTAEEDARLAAAFANAKGEHEQLQGAGE